MGFFFLNTFDEHSLFDVCFQTHTLLLLPHFFSSPLPASTALCSLLVGQGGWCSAPEAVAWRWHLSLRALARYKYHRRAPCGPAFWQRGLGVGGKQLMRTPEGRESLTVREGGRFIPPVYAVTTRIILIIYVVCSRWEMTYTNTRSLQLKAKLSPKCILGFICECTQVNLCVKA